MMWDRFGSSRSHCALASKGPTILGARRPGAGNAILFSVAFTHAAELERMDGDGRPEAPRRRMAMSANRIGVLMTSLLLAGAGCIDDPAIGSDSQALTAAQCRDFQKDGKVVLCHATGSLKNPFTVIHVSESGCINGHSNHPGDKIAVDGSCGRDACLAETAPCDATLACCQGFQCRDGRCAPTSPADCSAPIGFTIPPGQVACYGGYMNATWCTGFGLPPQWSWVDDKACITNLVDLTADDAVGIQAKHRGDGSGSDIYNLGVCCRYQPAVVVAGGN